MPRWMSMRSTVVGIPRDIRAEVTGVVGRGETADALRAPAGAPRARRSHRRRCHCPNRRRCHACRKPRRSSCIGAGSRCRSRADVFQKFFRDDGDGRARVLQIGADARARQRLGRLIAGVARGTDFEGRQLDDFFDTAAGDFSVGGGGRLAWAEAEHGAVCAASGQAPESATRAEINLTRLFMGSWVRNAGRSPTPRGGSNESVAGGGFGRGRKKIGARGIVDD